MRLEITRIHHVGLVTNDIGKSENFYINILGLKRHHKVRSWIVLNEHSSIHLIHIPEAKKPSSLYHEIQHFALQVTDLSLVLTVLIKNKLSPFQMDFDGNEKVIRSSNSKLDFGIGTLFVRDPDNNLVEFLTLTNGVFQEEKMNNSIK